MYQLHYFPSNANAAPHVVLEEFDQKYDLVLVDRAKNAQKWRRHPEISAGIRRTLERRMRTWRALEALSQDQSKWSHSDSG
jgi:hypothetical protein